MKYYILLITVALFTISCTTTVKSKVEISNYSIEVSKQEKSGLELFKLTGSTIDSALWIYSYKIEYKRDKIFIIITKTLKPTGISSPYYIQFIVPEEVNRIYLGKEEMIWQRPK